MVSTNLRKLTDPLISWGDNEYGAALASEGLSLSKLFKTLLIPSGHPYAEVYPTGTHPLLDPLWSNESTHFMQDGNEADRNQKIMWQLSRHPVALKHLRVCWRNPDNTYNWGQCAKCIRTKINLHLAGVLDQCETFDNNIDFKLYAKQASKSSKERRMVHESLKYVKRNTSDKKIAAGLEYVLANTYKPISLKRSIKKFDRNYLRGNLCIK